MAIQIHGTSGGYDDPLELMEGFRVITLSRPGYLRTPLEVGKTPAEQAKSSDSYEASEQRMIRCTM